MPTIIPPPQPANPQSPVPIEANAGNITGSFPPTDPKTIQQRRELVEEVYAELTKPDMNCIVLTGIGGIGKSTAAALVYKYAEQRKDGKGPFSVEALWITVEETTATFASGVGAFTHLDVTLLAACRKKGTEELQSVLASLPNAPRTQPGAASGEP